MVAICLSDITFVLIDTHCHCVLSTVSTQANHVEYGLKGSVLNAYSAASNINALAVLYAKIQEVNLVQSYQLLND